MAAAWRLTVRKSGGLNFNEPSHKSHKSSTFLEHYSSREFHRRIICNGQPVTFAQAGDIESQHVILYCLPSGCSRYLVVLMDGICRKAAVRIIGIDRPGSGGTASCPLADRIDISVSHMIAVLQALDLIDEHLRRKGPPITLLTHSAGIIYALALCQRFQLECPPASGSRESTSPLGSRPKLLMTSPWVPVSISKSALGFLPPALIRLNSSLPLNKLAMTVQGSLGVLTATGKSWVSWSSGAMKLSASEDIRSHTADRPGNSNSPPGDEDDDINPFLSVVGTEPPASPKTRQGQKIRSQARQRHPDAHFLPPHETHYKYSTSARAFPANQWREESHPSSGRPFKLTTELGTQILFEFMAAEGTKGITEDFLLSLGHADGLPSTTLEDLLRRGVDCLVRSPGGAQVTCVWAEGDRLIPAKGRSWLDALFYGAVVSSHGAMSYERLEVAEAGHDLPITSEAVVVDLLRRAKEKPSKFNATSSRPPASVLQNSTADNQSTTPRVSPLFDADTPRFSSHPFASRPPAFSQNQKREAVMHIFGTSDTVQDERDSAS